MKKILLIAIFTIVSFSKGHSQVVASMYNTGRNYGCCHEYRERGHSGVGRFLLGTGLIAGGIALAGVASYQEYYVPNTMVYGTGAIMAIVGTSFVLTGINIVNREMRLVYTGNGVGVQLYM